jgi:hypothetical protein
MTTLLIVFYVSILLLIVIPIKIFVFLIVLSWVKSLRGGSSSYNYNSTQYNQAYILAIQEAEAQKVNPSATPQKQTLPLIEK